MLRGFPVNVTMMEITGKFRLRIDPFMRCQFVELPYVGTKFSMVLIVPHSYTTNYDLPTFESKLNDSELIRGIGHLTLLPVTVTMPKFNITQRFDLVQTWATWAFTTCSRHGQICQVWPKTLQVCPCPASPTNRTSPSTSKARIRRFRGLSSKPIRGIFA